MDPFALLQNRKGIRGIKKKKKIWKNKTEILVTTKSVSKQTKIDAFKTQNKRLFTLSQYKQRA